jgi:hypothetical protein
LRFPTPYHRGMTWIIAGLVALFGGVAIFERIQKPKREKAAREERQRRLDDVARRGWTLDIQQEPRLTAYTYRGTTEGVTWTCVARSWTAGSGTQTGVGTQSRVFTRWSTEDATLSDGMLAIWPSFGAADVERVSSSMPQFLMNLLISPLLSALEAKQGDGEMLTRTTPIHDPALAGTYLLRATDPAMMTRFLDAGARDALLSASTWWPPRNAPHHLVLGVLYRKGLALLNKGWIDDLERIDQIARIGVHLARAAVAARQSWTAGDAELDKV